MKKLTESCLIFDSCNVDDDKFAVSLKTGVEYIWNQFPLCKGIFTLTFLLKIVFHFTFYLSLLLFCLKNFLIYAIIIVYTKYFLGSMNISTIHPFISTTCFSVFLPNVFFVFSILAKNAQKKKLNFCRNVLFHIKTI